MTGVYQQTQTRIPQFREQIRESSSTQDNQSDILERLETLSNQTGELRLDVQDRSVKYITQLRDLGDDEYKLTEPIFITIEEYPFEDLLIASFPEVEVFGEGTTEADAILNLKWAILDLYQELIDIPQEEMGALPKSWFSVLQQIIKKNK